MPKPHTHHWKLPPPGGRTSLGHCKCGAEREFQNGEPQMPWSERWSLLNTERRVTGLAEEMVE